MQHRQNGEHPHPPEEEPKPARQRVLIVDDDRLVLTVFSKGLRQAGYDVLEASSAEQALEIIAASTPDIAVLDVSMPGISGLELARRLRKTSAIPFIFLSAYGDNEIVREAVEHGAVGYLVKPVDTAQIVPSIEAGLARAADIANLHRNEEKLTSALLNSRETSIATGILMERFRLTRNQAFEKLRNHARQSRRTVHDVATELAQAQETLNQFKA